MMPDNAAACDVHSAVPCSCVEPCCPVGCCTMLATQLQSCLAKMRTSCLHHPPPWPPPPEPAEPAAASRTRTGCSLQVVLPAESSVLLCCCALGQLCWVCIALLWMTSAWRGAVVCVPSPSSPPCACMAAPVPLCISGACMLWWAAASMIAALFVTHCCIDFKCSASHVLLSAACVSICPATPTFFAAGPLTPSTPGARWVSGSSGSLLSRPHSAADAGVHTQHAELA